MWGTGWRDEVWSQLDQEWDIIVIGGGITGAGILREATRAGLKALLVEQRDFAWGTSSRSSKLVHGGLRYLKEGHVFLTWTSVQERDRLMEEGKGLVEPLGFLVATYKGDSPGRWTYEAGLSIYDLLALQWSHDYYSSEDFQMLAPHLSTKGLEGGFRYGDAQTDDARLVLRIIQEAVADDGTALNYACVEALLRKDEKNGVAGVVLHDMTDPPRAPAEVRAKVIINATGAWADRLREQVGASSRIRPLRGSHLIFLAWRLPIAQAIGFLHPIDRRPVFIFPWEGITLVGTTDLEHEQALAEEPHITPEEVSYLMAAVEAQFPSLNLTLDDVTATFAGVRPVINTGKVDPTKESRDHVVWEEGGLLTVTGGKLTTFRVIALDVLKAVRERLPEMPELKRDAPVLNPVYVEGRSLEPLDEGACPELVEGTCRRLLGRYGAEAAALVEAANRGELRAIPGTQTLWAELRWAARAEGVVHLEDLMLRRTRLGLLLPTGGSNVLPEIRAICQAELGWDDARWESEEAAYLALWTSAYSLPERAAIPDWTLSLAEVREQRIAEQPKRRRRLLQRVVSTVVMAGLATAITVVYLRGRGKVTRPS